MTQRKTDDQMAKDAQSATFMRMDDNGNWVLEDAQGNVISTAQSPDDLPIPSAS